MSMRASNPEPAAGSRTAIRLLMLILVALCVLSCGRVDDAVASRVGEPPASATRAPYELTHVDGVDYSCNVPADCAIKDVGNCCGYFPACVNVASETFPERVKAECQASGMNSVCGYPSIAGCDCIEGRCSGVSGASATIVPGTTTEPDKD